MKVFIFFAFDSVPYSDEHPMRGAAIAEEFLKNGHEVYFITSSFSHLHKKFRSVPKTPEQLKIVLLSTKAYSNNRSIDRIISHQRLSVSLGAWIKKIESDPLPQLVIGAGPPLVPNYILVKFCKKHGIPYIYDILDLWPEEFLKFSPAKKLTRFLLKSYFNLADKIVEMSTGIIAVSSDYLNYYKSGINNKRSAVFYLGTDTTKFVNAAESLMRENRERKIILLGNSQGGSYVLSAARAIQNINGVKLTIAGLNHNSEKFRLQVENQRLRNIEIIPWIEMDEMEKILPAFDAGLILLSPKTKSAFPNRVFSYLAAGLPIVNSIRGGELEKFISENNFGVTINFANQEQIKNGILYCFEHYNETDHKRIQNFAKEHFNKTDIYKKYYNWSLEMINHQ